MVGKPNCLAQMVEAYETRRRQYRRGARSAGQRDAQIWRDRPRRRPTARLTEIRGMVEKPAPGTAPSNLMLPGRYILQPEVMRALDAQERGAGGEIQLTDAMAKLIGQQPFHALPVRGRAPRLRQRGGLRDRQSRDGAGARRTSRRDRDSQPRLVDRDAVEPLGFARCERGRAARRSRSPASTTRASSAALSSLQPLQRPRALRSAGRCARTALRSGRA